MTGAGLITAGRIDHRPRGSERVQGLVNEFNNMSGVAIINHDGPDPGIAHDFAHSWWIRDRLDRAQGGHGNEVLWYGPTPLIGNPNWPTTSRNTFSGTSA